MPEYRRIYCPGGTYFFTVNLQDRKSDLLTRHIDVLRRAWAYVHHRHAFKTIAVVILPYHLHCLWQLPEDDDRFVMRWRLLKSYFTRNIDTSIPGAVARGRRRKGERGVWKHRYWEHLIRDDNDLEDHMNDIHQNPVKHGLVRDADDWPWSSWHRFQQSYGKVVS
ncbi:MAG: transposase [Pseudomonadota bacterium]